MSNLNDYFNFFLNSDNKSYSISAKNITNIPSQVQIPREYNNLPVTNIKDNAFIECTNLIQITIPKSIKSIGSQAFKGCKNLLIVEFEQNSKLRYIGDFAFEDCINLQSIVLPAHISIIEEGAFYNCENLQKVYIKSYHPPILEDFVFSKTSEILSISVPKKSICMYKYSCSWCMYTNKLSTSPPNIPTDLGYFLFELTGDEKGYIITPQVNITSPKDIVLPSYYNNKPITDLGSVTFASSILEGSDVETIILNETLVTIYEFAFWGNYKLKEIHIPDSVETIQTLGLLVSVTYRMLNPLGLYSRSNLEKITFGKNSRLNYIGQQAFWGNTKLTHLDLPNSVTYIDRTGLGGLGITEIFIPENVQYIGDKISFTSINVEKFVVDCNNKYYKVIDDVLYNIDGTVLIDYPIKKKEGILKIDTNVEAIYSSCIFWGCQIIKAIILNPLLPPQLPPDLCLNNVYYKSLKIYVPDESLDSYKEDSSWGNYSSIIYPISIIHDGMAIENNTFLQYVGNDSDITLPDYVENISEFAFETATTLKNIYVSENNQMFTSVNGVLFSKDMTEIICYPQGREDTKYEIPESVQKIGFAAFIYSNIEEINIYDKLEEIGPYAFYSCPNLCNINVNASIDNIKIIDDYAFYSDGSIQNIDLENIEYLGKSVFSGCGNYLLTTTLHCFDIKNIILGPNIKYIGSSAILDENHTTLTIKALVPPINSSNLTYIAAIYVPAESLELYKQQWSKYQNIIYPISKSIMS